MTVNEARILSGRPYSSPCALCRGAIRSAKNNYAIVNARTKNILGAGLGDSRIDAIKTISYNRSIKNLIQTQNQNDERDDEKYNINNNFSDMTFDEQQKFSAVRPAQYCATLAARHLINIGVLSTKLEPFNLLPRDFGDDTSRWAIQKFFVSSNNINNIDSIDNNSSIEDGQNNNMAVIPVSKVKTNITYTFFKKIYGSHILAPYWK